MSNDLISRSVAIESIWSLFNNIYNNARVFEPEETKLSERILSDVQKTIKSQPTAYDVDKVVEKMKCNECEKCNFIEVCAGLKYCGYCGKCHKKIIEIIKEGGLCEPKRMRDVEKVAKIADTYGYDSQSQQCIEEMAELTQAINKFWRKQGNGQSTDKDLSICMDNIVEEIADVQIMLWQMAYLLNADVIPIIEQKLDRQLGRIEKEC